MKMELEELVKQAIFKMTAPLRSLLFAENLIIINVLSQMSSIANYAWKCKQEILPYPVTLFRPMKDKPWYKYFGTLGCYSRWRQQTEALFHRRDYYYPSTYKHRWLN